MKNLKQTNKNKAISSKIAISDFIEAFPLISSGVSFQTIFKIQSAPVDDSDIEDLIAKSPTKLEIDNGNNNNNGGFGG